MPNRYQSNAKKDVYETIASYEGEYCLACAAEGAGRRCPPSVKLEIDHAGRERHLLCKTHNLKYRRLTLRQHELLMAGYSAENVCVRIKKGELISKVRHDVDYREGSTEMKASAVILDEWLKFMNEYLEENPYITKDAAIYAGAYASGGNPSTIYRHVRTYTAFNAPFQEMRQNGEKVIILRPAVPVVHPNGHGDNSHKQLKETVPLVEVKT